MQQINLYQPHLRQHQQAFSSRSILRGAGIFSLGMVLLFGLMTWQTHQLEAQVTQYQRQRDDAKKLLNDLMCALPSGGKSDTLALDVAQLQGEVYNKQQMVARLAQRDEDNVSGYSAQLEGLARQRLPQLWLTRISLRESGNEVALYGSTTVAEQVPQYLQRLALEPVFHGIEFQQFSIVRSERNPGQVDFAVLTSARSQQQ